MQINLSKFVGIVVGVASLALMGLFVYVAYGVFFGGQTVAAIPTIESINVGLFGTKAQKAAAALVNATDKIQLKKSDLLFTESLVYKSFTEVPDPVPLSDSRGRDDPFVPYVAP